MDEKIDVKTIKSDVLLNEFLNSYMFKENYPLERYTELLNEIKCRLKCWQNLKDFLEDEVKQDQEVYQKSLKEE